MILKPIYCYIILLISLILLHFIILKIENKLFIKIVKNANECHVERFADEYILQSKILYMLSIFLFYFIYINISVFLKMQELNNVFLFFTLILSLIPIFIEKGNLRLLNHLFSLKFDRDNLSEDMIEATYILGEIIFNKGDLYFYYSPTKDKIKIIF